MQGVADNARLKIARRQRDPELAFEGCCLGPRHLASKIEIAGNMLKNYLRLSMNKYIGGF